MADEETVKYENPFKVDIKWKPKWKKKPSSSSSPKSSPPEKKTPSSTSLKAAPQWLPVPKLVMSAFILNLILILVAVVVSGLVLGGTLPVKAKAIGLTQSLVFFSSMFGIAYVTFHVFAARKPGAAAGCRTSQRSPLHTKVVILGRITLALWAVSMLAVGITIGSQPATATASLGPVRADLAACIINSIDMVFVEFVVERTRHPFVLPWVTPPIPEDQSSSAKALIDDILVDGVSGYAQHDATDGTTDSAFASGEASSPKPVSKDALPTQEVPKPVAHMPTAGATFLTPGQTIPEPFPSPGSTLVERQELWDRVDEGASQASPPKLKLPAAAIPTVSSFITPVPPVSSPTKAFDPYARPQFTQHPPFPPRPYVSPLQCAPQGFLAPSLPFAQASPSVSIGGPRPFTKTGRMYSYTEIINSRQNTPVSSPAYSSSSRTSGSRSVPNGPRQGGRRLFDKAVEGLKGAGSTEDLGWEDWSSYRVPGSFV